MEPVKPGTVINIDEITDYCDARYISAIEAVWHIFHHSMHGQDPPVTVLDCHIENEHLITFDDKEVLVDIIEKGLYQLNMYQLNIFFQKKNSNKLSKIQEKGTPN